MSDAATTNTTSPAAGRSVIFRIKRCEGPGKPSRWESFKVPVPPGANVISSLQWIAAHPVTTDGKETTPVVWDSGCLEEVCGACTMVINGKAAIAYGVYGVPETYVLDAEGIIRHKHTGMIDPTEVARHLEGLL